METEKIEIADVLRKVEPGKESIVDLARKILPDGKERIELALRQKPVEPVRAQSPRRWHIVHNTDILLDYVDKYGGDDTVILADPEASIITATLDERAPEGFEVITFCPLTHPLLKPWVELMEDEVDRRGSAPKTIADFVLSHKRQVIAPDVQGLVMLMCQIRVSKDIKVDIGTANGARNGLVCTTRFQGVEHDTPVELPECITIRCPIYYDRPERDIMIDLTPRIGDGGDSCYVLVTSSDLETQKIAEMSEIIAELRKNLEDRDVAIVIGLGRVNHIDWDYVK